MSHPVVVLLAVLAVLVAIPAVAQAQSAKVVLKHNDADGDGSVSRAEWKGPPPAFKKIDTDGDGILSPAELDARFGGGDGEVPVNRDAAAVGKWIDVHAHPAGGRGQDADATSAVKSALTAFNGSTLGKMILMPPPQTAGNASPARMEQFLDQAKRHPEKFVVMGGGGSLNSLLHDKGADGHVNDKLKAEFRQRAEEILAKGGIGFGEIAIVHVSLEDKHPFESEPGDHPLLLLLADIAAENDVPIDIHFDPITSRMPAPDWMAVPPNPSSFEPNIDGFERLLAHNRKARIVWAHAGSDVMGSWTPALSRRLLQAHPNLYMSLRVSPGKYPANSSTTNRGSIQPDWLALFSDFPDRFVIGNDRFFISSQAKGPAASFASHAKKVGRRAELFLASLPQDLAIRIGHENAARIYRLKE